MGCVCMFFFFAFFSCRAVKSKFWLDVNEYKHLSCLSITMHTLIGLFSRPYAAVWPAEI